MAPTPFSTRLQQLIDEVHPAGRGPYSPTEIVRGVTDLGGKLSAPYLSQLKNGRNPTPSLGVAAGIAAFFGVSTDFFTDDQYAESTLTAVRELRGLMSVDTERVAARYTEVNSENVTRAEQLAARLQGNLPS